MRNGSYGPASPPASTSSVDAWLGRSHARVALGGRLSLRGVACAMRAGTRGVRARCDAAVRLARAPANAGGKQGRDGEAVQGVRSGRIVGKVQCSAALAFSIESRVEEAVLAGGRALPDLALRQQGREGHRAWSGVWSAFQAVSRP